MDVSESPSRSQLTKLKVVELKEKLTDLGLSTTGLKADLVSRLNGYYIEKAQEQVSSEDVSIPQEENENEPTETITDTEPDETEVQNDDELASPLPEIQEEKIEISAESEVTITLKEVSNLELDEVSSSDPTTQETKIEQPQSVVTVEPVVHEKMEEHSTVVAPIIEETGFKPSTVVAPKETAEEEAVEKVEDVPKAKNEIKENEKEKMPKVRFTKYEKKKMKKKKKTKVNRFEKQLLEEQEKLERKKNEKDAIDDDVEVEYVPEKPDMKPTDPYYQHFIQIFDSFKLQDIKKEFPLSDPFDEKNNEALEKASNWKVKHLAIDDDDKKFQENEVDEPGKLSKKKLKKLTRLSVAELKQVVTRSDVVEMHDVNAQDPCLLVHLKATRNTVPIPRHWCYKRKYLQGKRGIEKSPFQLPEFIRQTGIMEMRSALQEKEDQKSLKAKMRERIRPKMGKIDIDYNKLHDAFFKWQTKPRMSQHGDLYFEGKEFETRLREKKPGILSDDLRTALGMPIGPNADKFPPPWLIAMQRYGPPPSYPNLRIAGLNAPIPEGCSFGYHAGGWGKPPVDEHGRPLYGDVFGAFQQGVIEGAGEDAFDKAHWGELESESEDEEEEEEEGDEDEEVGVSKAAKEVITDKSGLVTPVEGLVTPTGLISVSMGIETPGDIELRKKRIEDAMEGGDTPSNPLYTVLPEKKTNVGPGLMGSSHTYDVSAAIAAKTQDTSDRRDGIEVTLQPEELDMDSDAIKAKYEQKMRETKGQLAKEDLSDMVAEHAAKQMKRKKPAEPTSKSSKRYKEFKF